VLRQCSEAADGTAANQTAAGECGSWCGRVLIHEEKSCRKGKAGNAVIARPRYPAEKLTGLQVESASTGRMDASSQFLFPFVEEWPVDGAGTEIGHVLIPVESVDGGLQELAIVSKCRSVAWQQPLDAAVLDAFERLDEGGQIRTMVGVDTAHTAVTEDVIAGEQEISEAEGELSNCVSGSVPDFQFQFSKWQDVAVVHGAIEFELRQIDGDFLRGDFCEGSDSVVGFKDGAGVWVSQQFGAWEQFFGATESLDVVSVCVCGHQIAAAGEGKIELSNEFDQVIDRILIADVQQHPVGTGMDEVHAASQPTTGLEIELDNVGKQFASFQHSVIPRVDSVSKAVFSDVHPRIKFRWIAVSHGGGKCDKENIVIASRKSRFDTAFHGTHGTFEQRQATCSRNTVQTRKRIRAGSNPLPKCFSSSESPLGAWFKVTLTPG
jgi:hypothetical protein